MGLRNVAGFILAGEDVYLLGVGTRGQVQGENTGPYFSRISKGVIIITCEFHISLLRDLKFKWLFFLPIRFFSF